MLTAFQRRFLYFPSRDIVAGPADHGLAYEDVWLRTQDGIDLHAWWLPVAGDGPVVLFLHGNAGNVSYWVEAAAVFAGLGCSTLLLDYRGYGRSAGSPSEEGTYLDARAAWQHLVQDRGIDPSRIVVVGRSLGGGVATHLVTTVARPAALVLEATFTSIADVIARLSPLPGVRRLVRLGYPSLARMSSLAMPLLVLHGRQDDLVPFDHGRRLHAAAPDPKRFVELAGGHNDAFHVDRAVYVAALRVLLDDCGASRA